ncbi:MAG: hypothetical protein HY559_05195 [Gammaproteobacteria bacterium]|nr:hypothetical protein [Gammaproteobacteria bacterium]
MYKHIFISLLILLGSFSASAFPFSNEEDIVAKLPQEESSVENKEDEEIEMLEPMDIQPEELSKEELPR